jgi:hypothetical protein
MTLSWTVRGVIGAFLGLCEAPPLEAVQLSMQQEDAWRRFVADWGDYPDAQAWAKERLRAQQALTAYLRSMRLLRRV